MLRIGCDNLRTGFEDVLISHRPKTRIKTKKYCPTFEGKDVGVSILV